MFCWFQTIEYLVVVISDGWNIDAAITNMFVKAVRVGAAFRGMFIPFQAYGYFF